MYPLLELRLETAEKTRFAGESLADSLYELPLTIFLTGDLGAGKTTFLQGFAKKLGITEPLTSPTYALEQRYQTKQNGQLLHLDLYRLKEKDAVDLVESTSDHTGIRCIEWADRLPNTMQSLECIHLHFAEEGNGRLLTVDCRDATMPGDAEIDQWRKEAMLQPHIIAHCEAVAGVAVRLAEVMIWEGHIVRLAALEAAGKLHDLLRFVDFKSSSLPGIVETEKEQERWNAIRADYEGMRHEEACARLVRERGYPVIASIVETHGLRSPLPAMRTVEQKLLFYADKRCIVDRVVTVEERFADFQVRYTNGQKSSDQSQWFAYTKSIEAELFPNGIPF